MQTNRPSERKRRSISHLSENNSMWKGDSVGLIALHNWVKRRLPKPDLCDCCKKVPPVDLANIEIYDRDLKHWEWLCRKCHMTKDGRIEKLKKMGIKNLQEASKRKSKPIIQFDLNGNILSEFVSIQEAGRRTGIDSKTINNALCRNQETCMGFKWRYKNPQTT